MRRPPKLSSSPDEKKEHESQHPKKRVRPLALPDETCDMDEAIVEDITDEEEQKRENPHHNPSDSQCPPSAPTHATQAQTPLGWGEARKKLFSEAVQEVEWYVAESDSEDAAKAMKEDARDEEREDTDDPLCPTALYNL
ncbi:unnamed protein product [Linum trigynum]|uniref:Uncharacterized protein n=1 Tax=Linum trigynum TaxID=586398 RepID=A0AAV2FTT0_9ROSI